MNPFAFQAQTIWFKRLLPVPASTCLMNEPHNETGPTGRVFLLGFSFEHLKNDRRQLAAEPGASYHNQEPHLLVPFEYLGIEFVLMCDHRMTWTSAH
jgi:hypothetical protein